MRVPMILATLLATNLFAAAHLPVTAGASSWGSGDFTYDGAGNITAVGTDVYVYDAVGRLVHGTANGPANWQDYSYDSFGNRLHADTTGSPCAGTTTCGGVADVDWSTNRVRDHNAQYDPAGNLTAYNSFQYTFDGAGMISSITAPDSVRYEYVYTVDDERLATNTNSGSWRFTVRDLGGKVIREVNAYVGSNGATWIWDRDHVFRGSAVLATISTSGTEQFHLDHEGTPRLVTDGAGGRIGYHAYYPFGEELSLTPRESPEERLKFTGHERDASGSGGLDYMHARFFGAAFGRFLTTDPVLGSPDEPQTWNRFAYARNNPVTRIDPKGTADKCAENNEQCAKEAEKESVIVAKVSVGNEFKAAIPGVAKIGLKAEADVLNVDVKFVGEVALGPKETKPLKTERSVNGIKAEYSLKENKLEVKPPNNELSFKLGNLGFTISATEVSVTVGPPQVGLTLGVNPSAIGQRVREVGQSVRDVANIQRGGDLSINPGGNLLGHDPRLHSNDD